MDEKPKKIWEDYLDEEDRSRLEYVRRLYHEEYYSKPPGDMSFARNYVERTHSKEFYDALRDAETPEERALVWMQAELSSYPFRIEWPDSPLYDV